MNNPWETGQVYHGIRASYQDSQSRIDAVKSMSTEKLLAALDWPSTQSVVKAKIRAEIKRRAA